MTRDDPMMRIRLPEDLRNKVKNLADENHRSMNAEIVARLERTIAEDAERNAEALKAIQASPTIRLQKQMIKDRADLEQRIDDLAEEVAALRDRMKALDGC